MLHRLRETLANSPFYSPFPWTKSSSTPRSNGVSAHTTSESPTEESPGDPTKSTYKTGEVIEMRPLRNSCGLHVAGHLFRSLQESRECTELKNRDSNASSTPFTWCDHCLQCICGDIHARRCVYCHLTCHAYCCESVQLPCGATVPSQQANGKVENKCESADEMESLEASLQVNNAAVVTELPSPPSNLVDSAVPAFLSLLHEMSYLRTQDPSSTLPGAHSRKELMRHATMSAVTKPYDLSLLDSASLKRYGIHISFTSSSLSSPNVEFPAVRDPLLPEAVLHPQHRHVTEQGLHLRDGTHWDLKELWRRVDTFLGNQMGLRIALDEEEGPLHPSTGSGPHFRLRCSGTVRVHLVLIRPVRIWPPNTGVRSDEHHLHSDRGASAAIDLVNTGTGTGHWTATASAHSKPVWLPRGISKLVHVDVRMTSYAVISALLRTFQIEDNPMKFALYEHTIEGEKEVAVRKLCDNECPLLLYLTWAGGDCEEFNSTLLMKRLVLQENETNDIEWNGFTVPELQTFLSLLNREEKEYQQQIQMKYDIMGQEIHRLLIQKQRQSQNANDEASQDENHVNGSVTEDSDDDDDDLPISSPHPL